VTIFQGAPLSGSELGGIFSFAALDFPLYTNVLCYSSLISHFFCSFVVSTFGFLSTLGSLWCVVHSISHYCTLFSFFVVVFSLPEKGGHPGRGGGGERSGGGGGEGGGERGGGVKRGFFPPRIFSFGPPYPRLGGGGGQNTRRVEHRFFRNPRGRGKKGDWWWTVFFSIGGPG